MWTAALQCDTLRGHWHETNRCYVFYDHWYVVVWRKREAYLLRYAFEDDYPLAEQTLARLVKVLENPMAFTPWLWPELWVRIKDRNPFVAIEIKTARKKKWWIKL